MSVAILGGLDRLKRSYENKGRAHGCEIRVFSRRVPNLAERLRGVHGIVIFTGAVAHSMVTEALMVARKYRIPVIRHRSQSVAALAGGLRSLHAAQREGERGAGKRFDTGRLGPGGVKQGLTFRLEYSMNDNHYQKYLMCN